MRGLFIGLLLVVATSAFGATNDELVAFFPLRRDGADTTGRSPPMQLTNAPFVNGTLYLDGVYEYSGTYQISGVKGYRATASIPGLNYQSFTLSLDFCPLRARPARPLRGLESILNDWTRGYYNRLLGGRPGDTANLIAGGTSYRWLSFRMVKNGLQVTLNNQAFSHQFNGPIIQPRIWHNLTCSVDLSRKQIITLLDGRRLETVKLPDDFQLEVLGSNREAGDKELTFENYSNGSVFYGYAAHLRVFARALSDNELANLYTELAAERKALPGLSRSWALFILPLILLCAATIFAWRMLRRKKGGCQQASGP